jgi:dTDP-4-amino-4,6-dideoxygalactose transaminase
VQLPEAIEGSSVNGHMYYIVCKNLDQRNQLIACLKEKGIQAVFHYLSLHRSAYFAAQYKGAALTYSDHYTDCLVRLPLYTSLALEEQDEIIKTILEFYSND